MARPSKLTDAQKQIVEENRHMTPAQIRHLPGMEGRTNDEIRNYLNRFKANETVVQDDRAELSEALKRYIDTYGLPVKFHCSGGVLEFIKYLDR